MHVLVTGGAGFIGSAFVRLLLAETDHHVTVLDALTYAGNSANLEEVSTDPRYRFVHGDVTNRVAVREALVGHEAVVHLAAESHVDRSLLEPDVFVHTNCVGTNVMCDEAVRAGVDRFLHVSTDEVYGSINEGSFIETDPLAPSSPYSASKASSDLIALSHHTSHGLPAIITRSTNQFGPRQFPEKLIPHFVTTLICGGNVPVYGDGLQVRDWLHVDDNCRSLLHVLDHGSPGEIYNIGAHNERTNLAVTHAVLDTLGLETDRIDHVEDRPGHDRRYSVRTDKADALGCPAGRTFEAALEATVGWYLDHESWWQPLLGRVRNRS